MTIAFMGKEHMHLVLNTVLPQSFPFLIMDTTMLLNPNTSAIVVSPSAIEVYNTTFHILNMPLLPSHLLGNVIYELHRFIISGKDIKVFKVLREAYPFG